MMRNGDLIRAIDLEGVSQAAERLGITRQRLHQLIDQGKIDYYPFGKRRMVHKRDIDALIDRQQFITDELMKVNDAAETLGITAYRVLQAIGTGELEGFVVPGMGRMVTRKSVQLYATKQTKAG